MSGLQRRDIRYEGDPDLKPICTYEVPLLVRWLYSLALLVNAKVSTFTVALFLYLHLCIYLFGFVYLFVVCVLFVSIFLFFICTTYIVRPPSIFQYGSVIQGLYSRRDLLGTMCKLLIKAPETVYEYHKNNAGSPHTRVTKYLPPRISFRFQASKYVSKQILMLMFVIFIIIKIMIW